MSTPQPRRYYITTAIPYVNAAPHVGHGLEAVQVDAMARHHRQLGYDTYFLTGSDDNSITNVRAAEREDLPVADLVERNTKSFVELDRRLDVAYDQFIRTSVDPRHLAGAQKLWKAVDSAGDIYRQDYFGLYCPNCELFYDENELLDGLCPEHLVPPEPVHENNYFFRLSRYQAQLEHLIATDTYRVIPDQRKNEVLSFLRSGLRDFSISRSSQRAKGWGVPVPDDGTQVMYVWFDALSNYITALDYAAEGDLYQHYWVDNPCRVHAIGKGIIRFHAVYWPAMLLSAGVPLPHVLFVHGHYTVEGRKMSKSLGNSVDPIQLVDRYGVDAVRYYFLAATSPTGDSDFSIETFEARYNADLANDLGNLLNRTVSMIERYREGLTPEAAQEEESDQSVARLQSELPGRVRDAMGECDFQDALSAILDLVAVANKYVEQQAPWALARVEESGGAEAERARRRLDTVLATLAGCLGTIAVELQPFLPGSAARIQAQLGLGQDLDRSASGRVPAGTRVAEPSPLFPRIERVAATA